MKTPSRSSASSSTVSPSSSAPEPPRPGCFLGLDLGDRKHWLCVLDTTGTVVREGPVPNTRPALQQLLAAFPKATVALEAGTHSPWTSRFLQGLGATVFVANPRKVQMITRHERKSDRRDAHLLARLVRADPQLLHPIRHGTEQAQHDLLGLKLRDALVRQRVALINAVRFTLKSLGHPVRNPSSESFHRSVVDEIPSTCLPVLQPLLTVLETVAAQIRTLEKQLVQHARTEHPATLRLRQIPGVGPLTALGFVLKIGAPGGGPTALRARPKVALREERDQSGGTDRQLRISKCGDGLLRRLLVNAAHYILGPFGPPCALREHGQRLLGTGSMRDKKRAVVAVARKLAVLLLSLWKNTADYEPRCSHPAAATAAAPLAA